MFMKTLNVVKSVIVIPSFVDDTMEHQAENYDLDYRSYTSIDAPTRGHDVTVITGKLSRVSQAELQLMYAGVTVIHWDASSSHSALVCLTVIYNCRDCV